MIRVRVSFDWLGLGSGPVQVYARPCVNFCLLFPQLADDQFLVCVAVVMSESDISTSVKNGILFLEDPFDQVCANQQLLAILGKQGSGVPKERRIDSDLRFW